MKKFIYLLVPVLFSCTPGRSGEVVRLDTYCNNCNIKVVNKVKPGEDWYTETVFNGQVLGYKSLNIERFESDLLRCTQVVEFSHANNDSIIFVVIEDGDTLNQFPEDGTCF